MGKKYMFKTVTFGGFDKEEVMVFIKNNISDFEKDKDHLADALEKANDRIRVLEKRITSLELDNQDLKLRNAQIDDMNSKLQTANTKIENRYRGYSENYDAIAAALVDARNQATEIVAEAKEKAKTTEDVALIDHPEVGLSEYEKRYNLLYENLAKLNEATEMIAEKFELVKQSSKQVQASLEKDLTKGSSIHED